MNKQEFKNAFGYYRKMLRSCPNNDLALEWVESLCPLPTVSRDVLEARSDEFRFAKPGNRNGQYGWQNQGWRLGK